MTWLKWRNSNAWRHWREGERDRQTVRGTERDRQIVTGIERGRQTVTGTERDG